MDQLKPENIEENAKLTEIFTDKAKKIISVENPNSPNRYKKPVVCVVGMGYVGYPIAVLASSKGFEVYGYDTNIERLEKISLKENIFDEKFMDELLPKSNVQTFHDPRLMRIMDIFLIAVPTPVDEKYYPILDPVINASQAIAENMKAGALVILESTVNPGVSEEIVRPIFEKAGWTVGIDVFIAHCPERVNPGDPVWNVSNIPRVVGSFDKTGLKKSQDFYESIIDAKIMPMKSIRESKR
jgi:nucleotide sugar dehydrogenase